MGNESGIRKAINGVLYGNRLTVMIRILLGAMLIFSGTLKITDPASFGQMVAQYEILPTMLIPYAASLIPALELLLGLTLVIGLTVRASAGIAAILMTAFITFITINLFRGRTFECGCFQSRILGLGFSETVSPWLVVRNCIFLAGFVIILRAERHLLSLENFVEKIRLNNLEKTKYE